MHLERVTARNGPVYYVSPLLREAGVAHAFSTRGGGVSAAPFDSLNLGNPGGEVKDERGRIQENYARLLSATGLEGREHCWLHQVHGAHTACIKPQRRHDSNEKGDALASCDTRRVLSVRTADCCPVLLATSDGRCVAAIHAGWRGTVAETAVAALKAMLHLRAENGIDTRAGDILAAIGPCIGRDAFEVGPEVLDEFTRVFDADAPILRGSRDKGRADIRAAIRISLLRAGVPGRNIDTTDVCTHRDANQFFSHRRENGVTGRMAAVIGARR